MQIRSAALGLLHAGSHSEATKLIGVFRQLFFAEASKPNEVTFRIPHTFREDARNDNIVTCISD
jgi:hypothetical protein